MLRPHAQPVPARVQTARGAMAPAPVCGVRHVASQAGPFPQAVCATLPRVAVGSWVWTPLTPIQRCGCRDMKAYGTGRLCRMPHVAVCGSLLPAAVVTCCGGCRAHEAGRRDGLRASAWMTDRRDAQHMQQVAKALNQGVVLRCGHQ